MEEIAPHVMQPDLLCVFSDQKQCTVLHYTVRETGKGGGGGQNKEYVKNVDVIIKLKSARVNLTLSQVSRSTGPSAMLSLL